ncbi:MAG: glycosyltransferase [Desulfovibrio sp.]|jgi:glycosyltransferase involved in cell wall biosynthesis|nr:glycosyltransferase [Desulfovibrio sp.]
MEVLFIHQNFPGQYLHLARGLVRAGKHKVTGMGDADNIKNHGAIDGCLSIGYPSPRGAGPKTHHYLRNLEAGVRRGQAVARALLHLKANGFAPDVISLHPGWGEGLFVREIFPSTPLVMFCEYYFRAGEADTVFDPEFATGLDATLGLGLCNTAQVMSLLNADFCVSPTPWQASRYPECIREKIRVLHEGIDTCFMTPDPGESVFLRRTNRAGHSRILLTDTEDCTSDGALLRLSGKDKVITFAARNLEPYRGAHVFLRSLPDLQKRHPDAHILIIGNDGASYSASPPGGRSFKDIFLGEIAGRADFSRIHLLGRVPYQALRSVFRISSAHVYLSYPFVLSWSCLEAMSCEALVIASRTAPVAEAVKDGETGLMVDFFDKKGLIDTVDEVLKRPKRFAALRKNARAFVERNYALADCLKGQTDLLEEAAASRRN